MANTLIIVGADKGGVGKTTVSRTLIDYFTMHELPVRAFDTEFPKGSLRRFHPDVTEVVDITKVYDQIKILDGVRSADRSTIIDVRAGLLSQTLRFFRDIGFLEALKRAEVRLILFHVLGSSIASLREIEDVRPYVADARYYAVKNFVNDSTFFNWEHDVYESYFPDSRHEAEIAIPKLNEMAFEQVEAASLSFVSFIANEGMKRDEEFSFVLRGYVRHWLSNVWAQYDRINLQDALRPGYTNGRAHEPVPARRPLVAAAAHM